MSTISGTSGSDTLNGTNSADTIYGGSGNDTLNGGNGSDTLNGGSGSDTLNGGNGSDTLNGGNGSDTLNGGNGSDTLYGGAGNDELNGGSGDDVLLGGDGKDELNGGSGDDVLLGGSGNDELSGGSGDDLLLGGSGNDDIEGGSGDDIIFGGSGKDDIEGGSGDDIIFGGSGNDEIEGDSGDDLIYGGSGRDELEGDSGNDILVGGTGADWLEGGSGSDIFRYLSELDSSVCEWDRILDFKQGRDKIDLSALLGDSKLAWGGTCALADGAWFQNSGSSIFIFADTNGTGYADFKLELKNVCGVNLTSDDFIGVGVNSAPVADAIFVRGDEDTQFSGQLTASDADNDALTFSVAQGQGPAHGMLVVNEDGTYTYTPDANFHGTDEFTFRAFDGTSYSEAATVMLTVAPVNDAPEAQGQSGETGEDKDFSGRLDATDVDGDKLTYSIVSERDDVIVEKDGSFTVNTALHQDLDDNESYDVTFDYVADDGEMSSAASVTVKILGANDAPETSDALHATNEDMEVTGSVAGSTIDVDGDGLVFNVQGPTPDGLTFNEMTGDWSFDPRVSFNHLDDGETAEVTFRYRADDGDAKSNISTVTINIDGVNDAPDVQAHTHTVKGSDDFGHVLDGAMDPEGHTVTFNGFSFNGEAREMDGPVVGDHGYIVFTSTDPGFWSYSATPGDEGGDDIFEYTVSDGHGGFTTGTLTITVPASAGSPASLTGSVEVVAVDDAPSAPADDTSSGDESGDSGSNGAPNGNGTSYSYGSNTAPVAVADEIDWVNGGISGNILANDSDLDIGDSLIVTDVKGSYVDGDAFVMGDYGFLMITSGGDFTYGLNGAGSAAIAAGTSGAVDMFEYTIQDASGAMASSYLAVHVTDGDYVI